MDVAFVSSNPGKVREVRAVLGEFGIRVRSLRRELAEPQADLLEDVVRAKLDALSSRRGLQLVEDSGLFLEGLGGFPGVYSAYVYRLWGGDEGFRPILELLRHRSRRAVFRTVAGLRSGKRRRLFRGECRGTIASGPRGRNGFGFDPIFIPDGYRQTFGELAPETKLAISHRGRAIHAVGAYIARDHSE